MHKHASVIMASAIAAIMTATLLGTMTANPAFARNVGCTPHARCIDIANGGSAFNGVKFGHNSTACTSNAQCIAIANAGSASDGVTQFSQNILRNFGIFH